MKTIKQISGTVTIMIMLLFCTTANAQNIIAPNFINKTPQQRAQYQTLLMKNKLLLDSAQIVKVQALNLKYAKKIEPLLKSDDARLSRLHEALTIQRAKDEELKKIFTAAQFTKYQQFENQLKQKLSDNLNLIN